MRTCIYKDSLSEIIKNPAFVKPNVGGTCLAMITCGIAAKLLGTHPYANALIASAIMPSFTAMHIIDHRISGEDNERCQEKTQRVAVLYLLTILPQLALIKYASLQGYKISYYWAPSNTFITAASASLIKYYAQEA